MNSPERYVERRISFDADSVATAVALCASSTESHVLYENRGSVCWAEGELAAVEVDAAGGTRILGDVRQLLDVGSQLDDAGEIAAGSQSFDAGSQRFDAGSPRIDAVEVDAADEALDGTGERHHFGAGLHPLDAVGRALAAVQIKGWRAYGWVTFEMSRLQHGGPAPAAAVARFFVPRRELRLSNGFAELRATNEQELYELAHRLTAAIDASRDPIVAHRIEVDVADHDARAYRDAVASAVRDIRAGELEKVILSRAVPVSGDIDLPATYLVGRRANDPARSFLLRLGGWEAAGFSPEIVARVSGAGRVATQPLAGTRALEGDRTLDLARRQELYRDAKEVFEHAISVRLAAAELAGICVAGSVRIDDFMSIKERGSVQHLGSELTGTLREGATCWDALAALFPAVTASGIPKASACQRIREVEATERGLYSGAVLTVDADGSMDAALVLRSVFRRDGRTWLRAGAGIVAQSDPERELEETREKLRSVCRHLVPAGRVAAGRVPGGGVAAGAAVPGPVPAAVVSAGAGAASARSAGQVSAGQVSAGQAPAVAASGSVPAGRASAGDIVKAAS